MSTKTEEKDGGKEQVGDRPAKLNEKKKKSDRETFCVGRTTLKTFINGEKMRNPSDLQGENEQQGKKTWTRTRTTVPP